MTAAMENERVSAVEDLHGLELELDLSPRLLTDLRALVDRHPLRERATVLLMTALQQAGRTAEASEAYCAFRARLIDETGLEPASWMVDLHLQLLVSSEPGTAPGPAALREMLADARSFALAGASDRALACLFLVRALAVEAGDRSGAAVASAAIRELQGGVPTSTPPTRPPPAVPRARPRP
jgi:hypothetical protein